ncbi:hypothetical protein JCM1840_001151 [Sporobolomyces johnsonii]
MHRNSTLFIGYVSPVAQSCSSYSVLVESAFPPYQLDAVLLPAAPDLALSPDQVLSSLGEFADWRRWHGYRVNAEPGTEFAIRARDASGQVQYAEPQKVVPGGHRECEYVLSGPASSPPSCASGCYMSIIYNPGTDEIRSSRARAHRNTPYGLASSPSNYTRLSLRLVHVVVCVAFALFVVVVVYWTVLAPVVRYVQRRRMAQQTSWSSPRQPMDYRSPVAPKRRTFDV